MRAQYGIYVWEPFMEDFLRLGWLASSRPIYDMPRGEHPSWLMLWICDCQVVKPKR